MGYKYDARKLEPVFYKDVLAYFDYVGRLPKCPVCPHNGNWNFHVDGESHAAGNPIMVFMDIPQTAPPDTEPTNMLRVISLECPRCGHLEFIQAARVHQFLEGRAHRARKDGEVE